MLWSNFTGIAVVAVGLAYALVTFFTSAGPVSVYSNQRLLTPKPTVGRSVIYTLTIDRREGCPGVITDGYSRKVGNNYELVTTTRPAMITNVAIVPNWKTVTALPEAVTLGKWHYSATLFSDCPTRKRADLIIEADIEVVEP